MKREPQQIYEELLVLKVQAGNEDAIAKMVSLWHPRLIRFARSITNDAAAADDAVQESWIAILKGVKNLNDAARFRSWVFRIVHNKAYDVVRRTLGQRKAIQELANNRQEASDPLLPANSHKENRSQTLRDAIQRLPDDEQQILTLYYEEGLSVKEIELVVGASVSAIKSKLDRLRKKLKSILERHDHE